MTTTFMKRELFLLPLALGAAALISGCQSCCPDCSNQTPTAAVTAPVAPPPPSQPLPPTIRINAGIGAVKDATGVAWLEDTGFTGGDVIDRPDLPLNAQLRRDRYHTIIVDVEPNKRYFVAAQFNHDQRFDATGGYWEPSVWRTRDETCR